MRVLVQRRIIAFGILFALLCLTPATSPPAFAKPISWEPKDSPDPPPPKGDGDGVIVKASSIQVDRDASSTTVTSSGRTSVWSLMRGYLRLVRLGYGLRWF